MKKTPILKKLDLTVIRVCTIVLGCFSVLSVHFQAQISRPYPCSCPGLKERFEADNYRLCAVHFLGL